MAEAVSFSAREMEVLALAWQCMESEPKIDIDKLASLTGYTHGSASVTMGNIKRKLKQHAASVGGAPVTPKKGSSGGRPKTTPKSTGKRGASATGDADASPTKKQKGAAPKKRAAANLSDDDEEFGDFKIKGEEKDDILRTADDLFRAGESDI
ncbi:hypothetical protein BDV95DRAFT_601524 [Massariosphaeria phaeospora]|uniref:Uncharacterized protein n=1 Tax=Massariosphaeria phaeospora TaxID=100035 RepID=A0A7C8IE62_9PLEO|nr:hypothetical protein BDV95DRAFT_601524 [Massariosphaeria phaeospora]